jgi:tRNA-dihydrouridine synthase C
VNRSDGGSIILRQPERVATITRAVRAAVPAQIPVTVKTRLGYEHPDQFLDIVRGIADAGANEIIVHARTRQQGYRPPAYWEEIALAQETVNVPIVANGEIWSAEDALRCQQKSACQDLMLGRGALCRPDLPRLVRAAGDAQQLASLNWAQVMSLILRYYTLTLAHYDASYAGNPIKQWLVYLRMYYPQAALLFERIKRLRSAVEIDEALRREMAEHGDQLVAA